MINKKKQKHSHLTGNEAIGLHDPVPAGVMARTRTEIKFSAARNVMLVL